MFRKTYKSGADFFIKNLSMCPERSSIGSGRMTFPSIADNLRERNIWELFTQS